MWSMSIAGVEQDQCRARLGGQLLRARTGWTKARQSWVWQWAGATAMGDRAMEGSGLGLEQSTTRLGQGTSTRAAAGAEAGHDYWCRTAREARRGGLVE